MFCIPIKPDGSIGLSNNIGLGQEHSGYCTKSFLEARLRNKEL